MRVQGVRLAAIAAVSALALAVPASANHSWGGYHWASTTAGSLTLDVLTSNSSYWETAIAGSVSDWNNPVVGGAPDVLTLRRTASSADRKRCSPIAGKTLVCNYAYGKRGWLGIASIWLSNGHISQATTKLNDSYYQPGSRYDTPAWRNMVACQEVGHDFGLDHQDETFTNTNLGTCMDYTNDPTGTAGTNGTKNNERPNFHDYEELGIIYNHADSFNSAVLGAAATNFGVREVGKAVAPGLSSAPSGDSPAEWGRAIRTDAAGRPNVFVKDLGAGQKVITHVFWALETKRSEIQ
jgi:hypothetical protein